MITSRHWIAVSAEFCMREQLGVDLFSLSHLKSYHQVEILSIIYCKNNLRIDYIKRLTCLYELYGYYLEVSSARHDLHKPVDY